MIHCPSQCSPALHCFQGSHATHRRAAVARSFPKKTDRRPWQRGTPCRRPRATPEVDTFLGSPVMPGSPAATGDISAFVQVSAVMLVFYLVANFVVPEILMKDFQAKAQKESAAASPPQKQQEDSK